MAVNTEGQVLVLMGRTFWIKCVIGQVVIKEKNKAGI